MMARAFKTCRETVEGHQGHQIFYYLLFGLDGLTIKVSDIQKQLRHKSNGQNIPFKASINQMQIQQKKSLLLLVDNQELLQKLPSCLAKHIETYENIHRDIDSNEQNLMSHYRSSHESSESHLQQLVTVSTQFIDIVSRLKNNFTALSSRYGSTDTKENIEAESEKQGVRISNFDMFVSEHSQNSVKHQLEATCSPLIEEEHFEEFQSEMKDMEIK